MFTPIMSDASMLCKHFSLIDSKEALGENVLQNISHIPGAIP